MMQSRRAFLRTAAAGLAGASLAFRGTGGQAAQPAARRMKIDLCSGRIGVRANQSESIELARRHAFEAVEPLAGEIARASAAQLQEWNAALRQHSLVWSAAGLPVEFRADEARFQQDMNALPETAAALERAGVGRVGTWLRPSHDELTYLQNFKQHARRLRAAAKVLADHGQRLGLEYVGPKTSWTSQRYAFIHTMAEMKELIEEIGTGNVGFVLDSWHWYTAGETEAHLLTLENADVVAVDLNDAPSQLRVEQQMDLSRELPCATGVIDVATFLKALVKIGYDGPVRAEPFNATLREMPDQLAVAATSAAMHAAFALLDG